MQRALNGLCAGLCLAVMALSSGCAERVLTRDQLAAMRPPAPAQPSIVLAIRKSPASDDPLFDPNHADLRDALRHSHLFKEVGYEGETSEPPDYILEVNVPDLRGANLFCGEGLILPIFTLGVIPLYCKPQQALDVKLLRPDGQETTTVAPRYSGGLWVGLVSFLLLPSDSWQSPNEANREDRFDVMVAYRIYDAIAGTPFTPSSPDLQ